GAFDVDALVSEALREWTAVRLGRDDDDRFACLEPPGEEVGHRVDEELLALVELDGVSFGRGYAGQAAACRGRRDHGRKLISDLRVGDAEYQRSWASVQRSSARVRAAAQWKGELGEVELNCGE